MALLVLPISNTCSSISNTSNIWQHGRDTSINISSNSSNSSITNTISIISLMDRLLTNSQWYVLQRAKSVFYLLIMYRKKWVHSHVTQEQSCSMSENYKKHAHAFKILSVLTLYGVFSCTLLTSNNMSVIWCDKHLLILLSLKNLLVPINTKFHTKSCYYLYLSDTF